ncbi:MAG: hypothetical protein AB7U95_21910 [Reyranella sp.]
MAIASRREIVSLAQLLLVAAHETTVNLIGNGALALLHAPGHLALLRRRPKLIGPAAKRTARAREPRGRPAFTLRGLESLPIALTEASESLRSAHQPAG